MSNSDDNKGVFELDTPVKILKTPPLPQPGYGLLFSETMAQQISEFVDTPFFKQLRKVYTLQAKTRAARTALNSAKDLEWLSYYRGIAAAADLLFKDLESTKEEYLKANSEGDRKTDKKFKS